MVNISYYPLSVGFCFLFFFFKINDGTENEKRKYQKQSFFFFSSVNAFNLDWSNILSFGKHITLYHVKEGWRIKDAYLKASDKVMKLNSLVLYNMMSSAQRLK